MAACKSVAVTPQGVIATEDVFLGVRVDLLHALLCVCAVSEHRHCLLSSLDLDAEIILAECDETVKLKTHYTREDF
jgi:hypothetical protein